MSRVSICLLTYNRAAVLGRSIESLLAQTYRDFELIVNDDRSTDDTESVVRRYVEADPRVIYYRNSSNLRYSGNQNAAIARANGDLVAIVHDGDIYRDDCIARWVAALDRFPTAGIAFSASDALDADGKITVQYRHPFPSLIPGREMIDEMFRQNSSPIFGIVMVRKAVVRAAGEFNDRFPILADVDMWMRLLLTSDAVYINEPLFQIHPREANHVNRGVNWRIINEQFEIFETNIRRRFPEKAKRQELEKLLMRRHRAKVARACFWCLRHGRVRSFFEGLNHLKHAFTPVRAASDVTPRPLC